MFLSGSNNQTHMCGVQRSYFIVICLFYRNLLRLVAFPWERLDKAQWHSGWSEGIRPCLSGLPKDSMLISHLGPPPNWNGCSPTDFHSRTSLKALFLSCHKIFVDSTLLSFVNQVNLLPAARQHMEMF